MLSKEDLKEIEKCVYLVHLFLSDGKEELSESEVIRQSLVGLTNGISISLLREDKGKLFDFLNSPHKEALHFSKTNQQFSKIDFFKGGK